MMNKTYKTAFTLKTKQNYVFIYAYIYYILHAYIIYYIIYTKNKERRSERSEKIHNKLIQCLPLKKAVGLGIIDMKGRF